MEVFYTFTRAPRGRPGGGQGRRGPRPEGDAAKGPRGKGRGKPKGKSKDDGGKPRTHSAKPPRADKPIDPDNPFAALMALKKGK